MNRYVRQNPQDPCGHGDVTSKVILEASDLQFPIGKWPNDFFYENTRYYLMLVSKDREGDVTFVRYATRNYDKVIEVLND